MRVKQIIAAWVAMTLILLNVAFAETFWPATPAEVSESDISMDDAIYIAKKEMTQRLGTSPESIGTYKIKACCVWLMNRQKAWVVMLDELSSGADALVIIASADAAILSYESSNMEMSSDLVRPWTKKKGATRTWTIEEKAFFNWLFGATDQYIAPTSDHISKEAATRAALATISQPLSVSDLLYAFRLLSYTDGRPDQYVWEITIYERGQEAYFVQVSAEDGTVIEAYPLDYNG